jgi:hypothetical protein
VPNWAEDAAVRKAFPELAELLKKKQSDKTALIKTNEGWIHEGDFDE